MADQQEAARAFLRQAVEHSGLSPYALAKRAGVSSTTITRPLNDPNFKNIPKAATLLKIAEAAGLGLPSELAVTRMEMTPIIRRVPVLGDVQAGAWREVRGEPEVFDYQSVDLPDYAQVSLFALRVVGRSMDLVYPDGTTVIVAPPQEAGLREGDHVVVRRDKNGLTETTLKEIVKSGAGYSLEPRSTEAGHLAIPLARDTGDDGVTIIGVVIQSIAPRRKRSGPIISVR